MLILLPPSEGKTAARRGASLDLASLSFPALTSTRSRVLDALVSAVRTNAAAATRALGVPPARLDLVALNQGLREAPTTRADRLFTGVLFDILDLPGLDAAARRRAAHRVVIAGAAFGLLRPGDRVPDHRLSAGTRLPGLGSVDRAWRAVLPGVLADAMGAGLLLDLRSQAYVGLGVPRLPPDRVARIRVVVEHDGRRRVVSHANKATKGRLVRDLLVSGAAPRTRGALLDVLRDLGWQVEADTDALDVVVDAG